jgi:hypothetical protein
VSLQLRISRNTCGTWTVQGLSPEPASNLPSLSASIDYARTACDAAPTTIELFVDGMYIVMHQKRGWQRPLFASQGDRTLHGAIRSGPRNISLCRRFFAWLRGSVLGSISGGAHVQRASRAAS